MRCASYRTPRPKPHDRANVGDSEDVSIDSEQSGAWGRNICDPYDN